MELIDKATVIAEIERLISNGQTKLKESEERKDYESYVALAERIATCINVLSFLDTLKVKEVDLEQEIQEHINECLDIKFPTTDIKLIAKDVEYTARKFFELGMKVSNKTKKDVSYVKIDRKVLFEMCDAILNHDGYADRDDCPEDDLPYFVGWWDSDFRKKVVNIRNNS